MSVLLSLARALSVWMRSPGVRARRGPRRLDQRRKLLEVYLREELCVAPFRHVGERPIEQNGEPVPETDEVEEVNRGPCEPSEETAQLDAIERHADGDATA